MIKREDLRNAINAISARDPEIGYSIDELFLAGQIDVSPSSGPSNPPTDSSEKDIPFFFFDDEKVYVNKISYFNEKSVPIEQRLLIKYGELVEKQKLENQTAVDFRKAPERIRQAGLNTVVNFEIDYAMDRIQQKLNRPTKKNTAEIKYYNSIYDHLRSIQQAKSDRDLAKGDNTSVLFEGKVGNDLPALFMHFPFNRESLCQVSMINLEFFHVRFILNCLIDGFAHNLFACVINEKITGLLLLHLRKELFYTGLEVKYISTITDNADDRGKNDLPIIKGIGTFLMAGAWLLWKSEQIKAKEIFLESEISARHFYESMGFIYRHPMSYVLRRPKGYILTTIPGMAKNCGHLNQFAVQAIKRIIPSQIKLLKKPESSKNRNRQFAFQFISSCLELDNLPEIKETAYRMLTRHEKKIQDADRLFPAKENLSIPIKSEKIARQIVSVVCDKRLENHLKGIFHIESAKRMKAVFDLLEDKSISDSYVIVEPRPAEEEELARVHTPAYIKRIARTANKPLSSFDLDTQASEKSYETARLAVGGVFCLIDEIWTSKATSRGFAFVRPPGHHAGPDKAMGFCLFNNPALGARYLTKKYSAKKVMIIDIDVHHGNGLQSIFYDSNDVLYFSVHQFPCYPGTGKINEVGTGKGEGFTINVPMGKGHGDMDIAKVIRYLADPVAREFQPDMILVDCGFDLYVHDPLGGMNVTPEGYALITLILKNIADKVCQGRIAFIMEGGYSIQGIKECGLRVMKELCDIPTLLPQKTDKLETANLVNLPALIKAIEVQKKYWKSLR